MTVFFSSLHDSPVRSGPIRLLIVDDSVVMRAIIAQMFEDSADIEVAAMVATAQHACDWLSVNRADIILLDHEMPGQTGLDALPRIVSMAPDAHVIMLSSFCERGSDIAIKALSSGASEALLKPRRVGAISDLADDLVRLFHRLVRDRHHHLVTDGSAKVGGGLVRAMPSGFRPSCIGIGASTGGIHILAELLTAVQGKPGVPLLITQHLPEAFIDSYARHVGRMIDLPVSVARHGCLVEPDHIYIAPGHASLCCRRHGDEVRVSLVGDRDTATLTRPSVNRMLASMADCFGDGAMGIILSGIGRDGTIGAQQLVNAGGVMLAQDQMSSIVWGMPGAIARAGLASAILSPGDLARYVGRQDMCHA